MLQPGTVLNRKYRIEAVIGQGRLGYVYRARDQLTSERVAIKELVSVPAGNPQPVNRFIEEARGTLRLTQRDIARVHDIFLDGSTYYLAMEYLPGGSLADMLRFGPLPVDESLRIVDTLCRALGYAHELGVMHCDIKPSNVLFDAGGGVHLADFAIAWLSEDLLAQRPAAGAGVTAGTVQYMAPEQLDGACDDPRVDIYALGALLYEMLCGQPYSDFENEATPTARMRNAELGQTESPRTLRALNPDVPQWLEDIVARTLQKAPERRYASVAELQQALSTQDPGRPQVGAAPQPEPESTQEPAEEPEPGLLEDMVLRPPAAATAVALQLAMPDGSVVPLKDRDLIIGRGAGSDLVLSDTQVSRRHATIEIGTDGVQVIDLDSANGTFVNDERLARQVPHPLQAGDTLRLGESAVLHVQAGPAAPVRQAAAAPPAPAVVSPPVPEPPSVAQPPVGEESTQEPVQERKPLPRWIWALLAGIAAILLCLAGASALLMLVPGGDRDTPTPAASVLVASPTAGPGVAFTDTALPDNPTPEPPATGSATSPQTPAVTASATATSKPSATATDTATVTSTPVPSPTVTDTPTATASSTPAPTPTRTETATPTSTATPTPTATLIPTATGVPAPTNTVSVPLAVSDLVVESIDFMPFPPQQGLGNQVIITIRNDGPGNAGPFDWAWQAGSSGPWTGRLTGLEAGESTAVVLTWIPTSLHAALPTTAQVDAANEVVESNENNNRLQVDVEVVQRP